MSNIYEQPFAKKSSILILRAATTADLNHITHIHEVSFVDEPEQNYRFPYRDRYPEDYRKWTRKEYEGYLKQPDKFAFHIVEGQIELDDVTTIVRPIAFAVWDIAVRADAKLTDIGLDERRDANRGHCNAFANASKQRPNTHFAEFGDEQIFLSILATHPDFRRQGAGSMLCDWGLNYASERHWPVTVCASPIGRLLYERLGFKKIAAEVIRVEGEKEVLETTIMVRGAQS